MSMDISQVKTIGKGLMRPEGAMALDDGTLYAADGRGQCAHIQRDGRTEFFGDLGGAPNGICIDPRGPCIVANIGNGQVQSVQPDGRHEILLTHAGGRRMRAPNFPFLDSKGRLWVSNSTEQEDISSVLVDPKPDGCVVLIENGRARIVAEGIYFANGLTLDHEEACLYVAQTMRRNILRYRILSDGTLGPAELFGPDFLGRLGFPDGIAFDAAGNLWVTFPQWNAVGYITPAGVLKMYLEDPQRRVLQRPSNICFGWEGRTTAFIGNLDGTTIPYFSVPHPGMRLVHQQG
ncbi:MAG: SMP-30/gluconolactonase/LRE family protein [Desulfobacteraceae bacterium]|nr:MAG: SMP-30/gluconolactonase/LRE family protein [Desulfobacteraceae bacterium]